MPIIGLTAGPADRPEVVDADGGAVPSTTEATCDVCGVTGWVSDWPDQGGIVADPQGDPICDDCAGERTAPVVHHVTMHRTTERLLPGTSVHQTATRWYGTCACGWVGRWGTKTAAERRAQNHLANQ